MPNIASPGDGDERKALILTAAAKLAGGVSDPETAAAVANVTADQLFDLLATDAGARAVAIELDRMRDSGELLKAQTTPVLEKLVGRMRDLVEAGDVSASAAPKLADVLFKMTGLAEERAARLRAQAEDDTPKATVHILYEGEPEPPPAKPNEHRLIIRLPTARRPAKVIDITPNAEGGDDGA